jgi:hypothetical protein
MDQQSVGSHRFRVWLGLGALATPVIGLPIIYLTGDELYGQIDAETGAAMFGAFFVLGAFGVLIQILRGRQRAKAPKSALAELGVAVETLGFLSAHFMGFVLLLYYGAKLSAEPVFAGVAQPSMHQIVMYSLDQAARGILFDLMESYGFRIGELEHNTGNYEFATVVFVFRTVFSAAALNALWILVRNMMAKRPVETAVSPA